MFYSITQDPSILFLLIFAIIFIAPLLEKLIYLPRIISFIVGGYIVGPYGFHMLSLNSTIESLATVGILYLMFDVGLEIDLDQLILYRSRTIVFYLLTYFLPQISGIFLGWLFGLSLASSILLGAIYASYTLVAYPIVSELGVLKNEAIAITVSAVVLTDITALLALVIIQHIQNGNLSLFNFAMLCGGLASFSVILLVVLPHCARIFFRYASGKELDFAFVLVILFAAAALANIVGIQGIVGAFLAGLAVNRMISRESKTVKQILFTGEVFFVPFFLITIGMRINPINTFSSWQILSMGLSLTIALYVTKFAAAVLAGYIYKYTKPQVMTIWGLSQAQAAATLAIILIGVQSHLFSETILHATIILVLFTMLTSPLLVKYYAPRLNTAKNQVILPIFARILVAVDHANFPIQTFDFASRLARYGKGKLIILNMAERSSIIQKREEELHAGPGKDPDTEIEVQNRIVEHLDKSILNESLESKASFLILNWVPNKHKHNRIFSTELDSVIWSSKIPTATVFLKSPIKSYQRIVTIIGGRTVGIKLNENFLELILDIKKAMDLPLLFIATSHYRKHLHSLINDNTTVMFQDGDKFNHLLLSEITEGDIVIIPTMSVESRFNNKNDLIPYQLLHISKASLIVINFP